MVEYVLIERFSMFRTLEVLVADATRRQIVVWLATNVGWSAVLGSGLSALVLTNGHEYVGVAIQTWVAVTLMIPTLLLAIGRAPWRGRRLRIVSWGILTAATSLVLTMYEPLGWRFRLSVAAACMLVSMACAAVHFRNNPPAA